MTEIMTTPTVETPVEVVPVAKVKTGRPLGNQHTPFGIRITDDDLAFLNEQAELTGLTKAELIRNAIRNVKSVARISKTDAAMLGQIQLVGNNLNQMAMAVNTLKKMEAINVETLVRLQVAVENTQKLLEDFNRHVLKEATT